MTSESITLICPQLHSPEISTIFDGGRHTLYKKVQNVWLVAITVSNFWNFTQVFVESVWIFKSKGRGPFKKYVRCTSGGGRGSAKSENPFFHDVISIVLKKTRGEGQKNWENLSERTFWIPPSEQLPNLLSLQVYIFFVRILENSTIFDGDRY